MNTIRACRISRLPSLGSMARRKRFSQKIPLVSNSSNSDNRSGLAIFDTPITTTIRTYYRNSSPEFQIPIPKHSFEGDNTIMIISIIPATLKSVKGFVTMGKGGRLLVEFVAKDNNNRPLWDDKWNIALSPAEMGSIIAPDFPEQGVSLTRSASRGSEKVDKELTVVPSSVRGSIDLTLNCCYHNDDGYTTRDNDDDHDQNGPKKIRLHSGDAQVMRCLFERSIPALLGWDALLVMQNEHMRSQITREGNSSGGSSYRKENNSSPNISYAGPDGNTSFF